ncbi:MAG: U32 family peptidase C-terminal domain-containing protein [Candidatus Pacebacteria bacterium]|nr:U32 family peptidase C-terminal domain-containing protein [Candidatus Paceibacterota bacterium]
MKKPELLAPAGDLQKLKTALAFGADAVYFGLPDFSLRVRINNFTWQDIKAGVDYAHKLNKKAYITLNIFAHNDHLKKVKSHILKLKEIKPDALFVSDPGFIALIKEIWPEANISLSTQANCTNWLSARSYFKQGVKRVILGRELSLKEVAEIKTKVPKLEIETFVHGALCMAYSGRCFLSKQILGRDANLGDCVQPCRWEYEIKPIGHEGSFILGEEANGSYILNSQDLCLIKRIPEMIRAKIDAFKIEGRAKSVYYLANVVGAYRQAIDLYFSKMERNDLKKKLNFLYKELETKLNHRSYSEGFMFKAGKTAQNLNNENSVPGWEFCGQVINSKKSNNSQGISYVSAIKVHNSLKIGDKIEIIRPGYNIEKITLKKMRDYKSQKNLEEAHGGGGGQIVLIQTKEELEPFSVLRRKL